MPNQSTRLIFFERRGEWAAGLRFFGPSPLPIVETRSWEECWDAMAAGPSNLAALEAPVLKVTSRDDSSPDSSSADVSLPNAAPLVDWLRKLRRERPRGCAVVLSRPEWVEWEWLWREAGAAHVLHRRREIGQLATISSRHAAQFPPTPDGWREKLYAGLPWSDAFADPVNKSASTPSNVRPTDRD